MKCFEQQYSTIVLYGIGQYYERVKQEIFSKIRIDFLCDKKWDNESISEYNEIPIISREKLNELENGLILVCTETVHKFESIYRDLKNVSSKIIHVKDIVDVPKVISGKMLKEHYTEGIYKDVRNNVIKFDSTISDKVQIIFQGHNNELIMHSNIDVHQKLFVEFGNLGKCEIGDNTEILGSYIAISDAKVEIGKDCLLSTDVTIRTHDSHCIFDKTTLKRLNYAKDIMIGDNVWIAYRVILLGGAEIGTGSVVGTGSITSHKFGDHQIIVGAPAKTIRENVCWSKDSTNYFNRTCLEECISQDAMKYL